MCVQFLYLGCHVFFLYSGDLAMNFQALALERHQFAAKTKTRTALWMVPLWCVQQSRWLYLRSGEVNLLLCNRTNWLSALGGVRQDIGITLLVHGCYLPVEVLGPCDLLVAWFSREFQLYFACLEVCNHSTLVMTWWYHERRVRQGPRQR